MAKRRGWLEGSQRNEVRNVLKFWIGGQYSNSCGLSTDIMELTKRMSRATGSFGDELKEFYLRRNLALVKYYGYLKGLCDRYFKGPPAYQQLVIRIMAIFRFHLNKFNLIEDDVVLLDVWLFKRDCTRYGSKPGEYIRAMHIMELKALVAMIYVAELVRRGVKRNFKSGEVSVSDGDCGVADKSVCYDVNVPVTCEGVDKQAGENRGEFLNSILITPDYT